jgi:23S rRNA (uracil747-C5)-methyltransferase
MHCEYFQSAICRSCALLNQTYAATLEHKMQMVASLFPGVPMLPFEQTRSVPGSRIRARLAVFGTDAAPQFGFLNEQKQIAAVDQCPLHHPRINELVAGLPVVIREARLTPWSLSDDSGELKFIVVTYSPSHNQLMLQLVLRSKESVDRIRRLWRQHSDTLLPGVTVFSVNLQPVRSSMINGHDEIPVSTEVRLPIQYGSRTVLYGPQSFVQTNYETANRLYQRAAMILLETPLERILDLYCGTGGFSQTAAGPQTTVIGCDVSADSISCANASAAANGLSGATYLVTDSAGLLSTATEPHAQVLRNTDVVVCNPPRRGLDRDSLLLLRTIRPTMLLYSSCNPETLCRDAQDLSQDFRLERIEPFDMFPFTTHLEVLAVFRRLPAHEPPAIPVQTRAELTGDFRVSEPSCRPSRGAPEACCE